MLDIPRTSRPGSVLDGIATPYKREIEPRGDFKLPPGTTVISADGHWSLAEDVFQQRAPAHMKARVPRIWTDKETGVVQWEIGGKPLISKQFQKGLEPFERIPGATKIGPRLRDMDAEGIEKEMIFGNAIGAIFTWPDLEARECIYRIYNEVLAEVQAESGGRCCGVGYINFWDMKKCRDSIAEIKALGLKTYQIPQIPRGGNGQNMDYCSLEMDPLWSAIEEAGMTLCIHTGEFFSNSPGGLATSVMINFSPFLKNMGEFFFSGILDRHPGLQIVMMEGGLHGLPGALQQAELAYHSYREYLDPVPKHEPRYYWENNLYGTFIVDRVGLAMIDQIGADRVLWSADYPHPESVYGCGYRAMQDVVDAVSPDEARMMLGGTAKKLFNL